VTGAVKRANGVDKSSADRLEQAPDPVGAGGARRSLRQSARVRPTVTPKPRYLHRAQGQLLSSPPTGIEDRMTEAICSAVAADEHLDSPHDTGHTTLATRDWPHETGHTKLTALDPATGVWRCSVIETLRSAAQRKRGQQY